MFLWKPADIEQEPNVLLVKWLVHEVTSEHWDGKTSHFMGYNELVGEGRVSSAIIEFDQKTMKGRTESGRIYQLSGHPGFNRDAAYVWDAWCSLNKVTNATNTSDKYHVLKG